MRPTRATKILLLALCFLPIGIMIASNAMTWRLAKMSAKLLRRTKYTIILFRNRALEVKCGQFP